MIDEKLPSAVEVRASLQARRRAVAKLSYRLIQPLDGFASESSTFFRFSSSSSLSLEPQTILTYLPLTAVLGDLNMQMKKAYLILAFASVSIIALLYGISPAWFARKFLGVTDPSLNFAHILRALMCLYLALACFWLFSAFSDTHRNTAVLTTILFAGGLVTGRLVASLSMVNPHHC